MSFVRLYANSYIGSGSGSIVNDDYDAIIDDLDNKSGTTEEQTQRLESYKQTNNFVNEVVNSIPPYLSYMDTQINTLLSKVNHSSGHLLRCEHLTTDLTFTNTTNDYTSTYNKIKVDYNFRFQSSRLLVFCEFDYIIEQSADSFHNVRLRLSSASGYNESAEYSLYANNILQFKKSFLCYKQPDGIDNPATTTIELIFKRDDDSNTSTSSMNVYRGTRFTIFEISP